MKYYFLPSKNLIQHRINHFIYIKCATGLVLFFRLFFYKSDMHIVILGSRRSIHTVRWANALAERGHRVTILTMHPPDEPFRENIEVIKLPFSNPAGYLLNIPFVKKIIRRLKPDIVHSFYAFGHGFLGRASGFQPHLASVVGSDVYDDPCKNRLYRNLIIKNIEQAAHVCSTSNVMAEHTRRLCAKPLNISITPFGVDTGQFQPVQQKHDPEYDFVVGTVKAMKPKYGVDILIEAFAGFRDRFPGKKFKLILTGAGKQIHELKQLAGRLNLGSDCEFAGKIPHHQVPEYLAKMDLFVAVSRYDSESFGVAVVEAMSCEKPVIVSDAGGLPEVVQHNKNGIVVPRENVPAVTEAMVRLYEDEPLRKQLGQNARKHVETTYAWPDSVEIMEQVYRDISGRNIE